ncbi:MAG: N-acetylmuramoyl-L-alanine amidase [Bacillota bacterium]
MKIFIGVGHGGSDPGAVGNGLKESNVNLGIAKAMKLELEKYGIDVLLSRESDADDPLAEEIKECNAYAPDLAVDVHTNAGGGKGFEVFYQTNTYKEKSMAIGKAIESAVVGIGQNSRGLKTRLNTVGVDYFGFLRQINCPSVITECAFIDNVSDVARIATAELQAKFGQAYADGVLAYLRSVGVNLTTATTTTSATTAEEFVKIEGVVTGEKARIEEYLAIKNPVLDSEYIETIVYCYEYYAGLENIRFDVAFAQACLETGFFRFGGDVKKEQNNFCGLGAVGGGACGNSFSSIALGVLAHIQHLKAYANTEELSLACVDPRFAYVSRGVARYVEWLGINENPLKKGWATDIGYGGKILNLMEEMSQFFTGAVAEIELEAEKIPNWAEEAVDWAVGNGIVFGDGNGDLLLEKNVSRMEMCVFLHRFFGMVG